jgi:hypothetical protein
VILLPAAAKAERDLAAKDASSTATVPAANCAFPAIERAFVPAMPAAIVPSAIRCPGWLMSSAFCGATTPPTLFM